MFKNNNCFVLYYPFNEQLGHYTCLIKNEFKKQIYYYDPLGDQIDNYKKLSIDRLNLYKERHNSLIQCLLKSGFKIDYNNYKHQSKSPVIATCGRHCMLRCFKNDLSNEEYNKKLLLLSKKLGFNRNKYKDKLIFYLTNI
jgi:hypothetical protein